MAAKKWTSSSGLMGYWIAILLTAVPCAVAFAQCDPVETANLSAPDGTIFDQNFGHSVAVDGGVAVVGARQDDEMGDDAGAAYVYHHDGSAWVLQIKLTAFDGAEDDGFGISVAVDGDVILVGASGDDDGASVAGSAYVYRRISGVWGFEDKLNALDPGYAHRFGRSVAVDGSAALVGAWGADSKGAAYVFRESGGSWAQEAKLSASDSQIGDAFGWDVDIEGDLAAIAAKGEGVTPAFVGAVYLYSRSGPVWGDEIKLKAADGALFDELGYSISLEGNRLLAAAWGDDDRTGSVYVFQLALPSWSEETKLQASDGLVGDGFGWSMDFDGHLAVIGANERDDSGYSSGAAYLFSFDGAVWNEEARLNASDAHEWDFFGSAVAIDGNSVFVGAPNDWVTGNESGSAYIFSARCGFVFGDGFESGDTSSWSSTML